MMQGKNIRIFLADGSINGVVHAEIINWTGQIVVFPRGKLAEINRQEYEKSGIYFLINEDLRQVYIGETDNVSRRLLEHERSKDFWDKVCVVTSKDQNLTKSHIRYLENRLIALAKNNETYSLFNGNSGSSTIMQLPRPDMADMEYFLSQVEMVLPVLGLDFLKSGKIYYENLVRNTPNQEKIEDIPEFILSTKGITAYAQEIDGKFIVLEGSQISSELTESGQKNNTYLQNLRPRLLESGIINPETHVFVEKYNFNSPSAAAAVISGGFANGRTMWKLKNNPNKTYADWQSEQEDLQMNLKDNVLVE